MVSWTVIQIEKSLFWEIYYYLDFRVSKERNYQVKIDESLSNKFLIEVGLPQGGVLSPILFSDDQAISG